MRERLSALATVRELGVRCPRYQTVSSLDEVVTFAAGAGLMSSGSGFFFQAEDGIRDATVTGVQTCALPISCTPLTSCAAISAARILRTRRTRSEERRGGKECRSRWGPDHAKPKADVSK